MIQPELSSNRPESTSWKYSTIGAKSSFGKLVSAGESSGYTTCMSSINLNRLHFQVPRTVCTSCDVHRQTHLPMWFSIAHQPASYRSGGIHPLPHRYLAAQKARR